MITAMIKTYRLLVFEFYIAWRLAPNGDDDWAYAWCSGVLGTRKGQNEMIGNNIPCSSAWWIYHKFVTTHKDNIPGYLHNKSCTSTP